LKETNPLSKTKNLIAAEKFLNTASAIYDENGYLTKKTEVEELLHKIREEKDFGLSLTEIFEAPSIVSSTESFDAPQLSRDQLVGLEVLQPAVHIVTNAPRKINLSESFEVRVDLINTGKDPVFLLSLEGLVPEQFKYEKDEDSEFQSYDKQALNRLILNGKKLSPFEVKSFNIKLRTEDSKLSEAILSPKISYSNARGELYEKTSSPVFLKIASGAEFEFEKLHSKQIFDYLTKAFINDYMVSGSDSYQSGWRTLGQIAREGHVPHFSVYARKGGVSAEVSELVNRGLIEKQVSAGRGRSGEVMQIRIAYEKDVIKSHVAERIRNGH